MTMNSTIYNDVIDRELYLPLLGLIKLIVNKGHMFHFFYLLLLIAQEPAAVRLFFIFL